MWKIARVAVPGNDGVGAGVARISILVCQFAVDREKSTDPGATEMCDRYRTKHGLDALIRPGRSLGPDWVRMDIVGRNIRPDNVKTAAKPIRSRAAEICVTTIACTCYCFRFNTDQHAAFCPRPHVG